MTKSLLYVFTGICERSMVVCGLLWSCMALHGFVRSFMVLYGLLWQHIVLDLFIMYEIPISVDRKQRLKVEVIKEALFLLLLFLFLPWKHERKCSNSTKDVQGNKKCAREQK